jgi:hypothetical protein
MCFNVRFTNQLTDFWAILYIKIKDLKYMSHKASYEGLKLILC